MNQGYYDFQILTSKIDILKNNSANILFSVNAGKRYNFGNIFFENDNYFKGKLKNNLFSLSRFISKDFYSKKKVSVFRDKIFALLISNKFGVKVSISLYFNKAVSLKVSVPNEFNK